MNLSKALTSILHLFVLVLTLAIGAMFLFFGYNIDFFNNLIALKPEIYFKEFGAIFLSLSVLLCISFYKIYKAQFYQVVMKPHDALVNIKLIEKYLEKYFKNNHSNLILNSSATILKDNKLEIIANFKKAEPIEDDTLLNIEKNIGKILIDNLSYDKEFIFTLNFKK